MKYALIETTYAKTIIYFINERHIHWLKISKLFIKNIQ
jgi:hypothetical protein